MYAHTHSHNCIISESVLTNLNMQVNGIKGASILSAHKSFKLPTGVVIDVMHCIFLGVVNALMAMWFGVGHRGKPFSIRNKVHIMCRCGYACTYVHVHTYTHIHMFICTPCR